MLPLKQQGGWEVVRNYFEILGQATNLHEAVHTFIDMLKTYYDAEAFSFYRVVFKTSLPLVTPEKLKSKYLPRLSKNNFQQLKENYILKYLRKNEIWEGLHYVEEGKNKIYFLTIGEKRKGGYLCAWKFPMQVASNEELHLMSRFLQTQCNWFRRFDKTKALLYLDDLTGLYNYRYLTPTIEHEIKRAKRFKQKFSLLFLDLDNFKDINDHYGHLCGSAILTQVGQVLNNMVREVDCVLRYGGDEFVILLIDTASITATLVAERIRQKVEKTSFSILEQKVYLTISIGVASFPEHGDDRRSLLTAADESMYLSKQAGKNQVKVGKESLWNQAKPPKNP